MEESQKNNVKQKRSNRKSTYCMIYSDKQKEQWYMTEGSYVEYFWNILCFYLGVDVH